MTISRKIEQLNAILGGLKEIELGYPIGDNKIVRPRSDAVTALAAAGLSSVDGLSDLYSVCDGIDMPDVHHGYFIDSLTRLLAADSKSELRIVRQDVDTPVVPFASTRGGAIFAVARDH